MGAEELLPAPQEMFGILRTEVFYHSSEWRKSSNDNSLHGLSYFAPFNVFTNMKVAVATAETIQFYWGFHAGLQPDPESKE